MRITTYEQSEVRRMVKELPADEQPANRLALEGATALSNAELLAVFLGTPDSLDLATELLVRFGGMHGLVKASPEQLQQVYGIGPKLALQIKALAEMARRLQKPQDGTPRITSPVDAANLLMADMRYLEQEEMRVILLDTRNKVLGMHTVYRGSLNTAVVRVGEIFKPAIDANAAAIIISHNHPSGDPGPSPEDVHVTRQVVKAGELLDIQVLDHVVIGDGRHVSLKERGLGFE